MSDPGNNVQKCDHPDQPSLDILQAGLFYLLTQYTFRQCPVIASKIVDHLGMLCRHPQIILLPSQNRVFSMMLNVWQARASDYSNHAGCHETVH